MKAEFIMLKEKFINSKSEKERDLIIKEVIKLADKDIDLFAKAMSELHQESIKERNHKKLQNNLLVNTSLRNTDKRAYANVS
jgi:hypothetical protein